MKKGFDFISMHNVLVDSYLGQYGLFYDYFFKPNLVYRKVSQNSWAFYSLLQLRKRVRSYKVMEPYLSKIERKYKHRKQRDRFLVKLSRIVEKVDRPFIESKAMRRVLFALSRVQVEFPYNFKLTGTFRDFQLEKFDYNLLKYFFFSNSGYVRRVDGVYPLKDYIRFITDRTFLSNNRIYSPVSLQMMYWFYWRKKKPKVDFPLRFYDYSFYSRMRFYGLDNYLFQNVFIKDNYNDDNFFRFWVKSDYLSRLNFKNGRKIQQVCLRSNEWVFFKEIDLITNNFLIRNGYTWNNSKSDSLFVNDVYFYLSNWYNILWSSNNTRLSLEFRTRTLRLGYNERAHILPLGYTFYEFWNFFEVWTKLRRVYPFFLNDITNLDRRYPKVYFSNDIYWFLSSSFEKMLNIDWIFVYFYDYYFYEFLYYNVLLYIILFWYKRCFSLGVSPVVSYDLRFGYVFLSRLLIYFMGFYLKNKKHKQGYKNSGFFVFLVSFFNNYDFLFMYLLKLNYYYFSYSTYYYYFDIFRKILLFKRKSVLLDQKILFYNYIWYFAKDLWIKSIKMPVVLTDTLLFNFIYKNENFPLFLENLFNFSINEDRTVQSVLDDTTLGTSYVSDWYIHGLSSDSSAFFSVNDGLNSLNFYNAFSITESFEAERYNFYDFGEESVTFHSRSGKYKETSMPLIVDFVLQCVEYLATHFSVSEDPEILRNIDNIRRNWFLRRTPVVYHTELPFVFNQSYNLAYTIFFMEEYEFYWKRIIVLLEQDVYTLSWYVNKILGDKVPYNYRQKSVKRLEKRFSLFINKFPYNDIVYRSMTASYYNGIKRFYNNIKKYGNYYFGYGRKYGVTQQELEWIGDHMTLILDYKFLTYDYLLNFTMSIYHWYSFLSKSFGLVPISYHISDSFSSLLPQYRFELISTRFNDYLGYVKRINQWEIEFEPIGELVVTDPVYFLDLYNKFHSSVDLNKEWVKRENWLLKEDLALENDKQYSIRWFIDYSSVRASIFSRLRGGHRKRDKWRSKLYSKYFREPLFFFNFDYDFGDQKRIRKMRFNWNVFPVNCFYLSKFPWILFMILFFIM